MATTRAPAETALKPCDFVLRSEQLRVDSQQGLIPVPRASLVEQVFSASRHEASRMNSDPVAALAFRRTVDEIALSLWRTSVPSRTQDLSAGSKGLSKNNISILECFGLYWIQWPTLLGSPHAMRL